MTQSAQETTEENKRKGQYSIFHTKTDVFEWISFV